MTSSAPPSYAPGAPTVGFEPPCPFPHQISGGKLADADRKHVLKQAGLAGGGGGKKAGGGGEAAPEEFLASGRVELSAEDRAKIEEMKRAKAERKRLKKEAKKKARGKKRGRSPVPAMDLSDSD
ncbi:hypothetical protein TeGR_g13722 [Tetraparma gracilis]|uniref:Uncharacterized protein n=1 Tax=Tetraparma gracilis TaxID=2962635 RepID=A0ABQ6M726_9STRA|nr:hypothetical protein TeGR_g13722 [Tetraparma gracilis]